MVDEDQWGTNIADDLRLVGPAGLAFTDADDEPEIRLLRFDSRALASASSDTPAVRFALLRRTEWLSGRAVRVGVADLVRGTHAEAVVDTRAVMPEIDDWLATRLEVVKSRVANPVPTAGIECAWCPFIAGCGAHQ